MAEIIKHEVKLIPIDKIKSDGNNPNVVSKQQMEAIRLSMEKFGFISPLVVVQNGDGSYTLADGEHRWQELKAIGETEVQAYVLLLSDAERRILRQTLNKLRGEHDRELDEAEFKLIETYGELDLLKRLLADEDKLLNKFMEKDLQEVEPENVEEIQTHIKMGDLFQLGQNFLLCGDSTSTEDVVKLMQSNKADLVYTDPPYGIDYRSRSGSLPDGLENDEYDLEKLKAFFKNAFINANAFLKEGGCIYVWHSDAKGDIKPIFEQTFIQFFNMAATIIWVKNNASMGWQDYRRQHEPCLYGWKGKNHQFYGDRTETTIWEIDRDAVRNYKHPTQKPVALAAKAIRNSSQEGEIVLDLFGGSGSTLIACEQLNRKCYMMEISPVYTQIIINGWEKLTNKKAVKCE